MKTLLLACSYITPMVRTELERAHCSIHKDVPGISENVEFVVLPYTDTDDLHILTVWDVPREIIVKSLGLHLCYNHCDAANGYALSNLYWDENVAEIIRKENEPAGEAADLGELENHPF